MKEKSVNVTSFLLVFILSIAVLLGYSIVTNNSSIAVFNIVVLGGAFLLYKIFDDEYSSLF